MHARDRSRLKHNYSQQPRISTRDKESIVFLSCTCTARPGQASLVMTRRIATAKGPWHRMGLVEAPADPLGRNPHDGRDQSLFEGFRDMLEKP